MLKKKPAAGKNILDTLKIIGDNFSSLRIKNIRIYMSGQTISLLGNWMQQTAQSWVVWELSHSAASLGIVAFLSQFPSFLFGPWAGAFADRFDRKKILMITQILSMLLAFILAFMVQSGVLVLWHVYVLALMLGIVSAFDMTAEQAFISEIAGEKNIQKTIALNNSLNQLTRLIGPSIAGWAIASFGVAPAFWFNGIAYIMVVFTLIVIHSDREIKPVEGTGFEQFLEGLRYIQKQKLLRLVILFSAILTFFGLSIVQMMPAIASLMLNGNAQTLGYLLGAAGAGALTGTLFVVPFTQRIKRSCLAIGGSLIWSGCWYITFSFSRNIPFSMLCQFMASLGAANVLTLTSGLAQVLAPPHMRARIVSTILMISFGLQPLASYLAGWVADVFGISRMMLVSGMLMIFFTGILLALPSIRKLTANLHIPDLIHKYIPRFGSGD